MEYYYSLCKDCEHLYHCHGRDVGQDIQDNKADDMYLMPGNCSDYYPERKQ